MEFLNEPEQITAMSAEFFSTIVERVSSSNDKKKRIQHSTNSIVLSSRTEAEVKK